MVGIDCDGSDLAVLDVYNLIGGICHSALVRHDYDRYSGIPVQAAEEFHHLKAGLGVKCSGRLIGKDDAGVRDKGPGDCDSLFLASGKFVGIM